MSHIPERVILKDELQPLTGRLLDWQRYDIPSSIEARERFIEEYSAYLERYTDKTTAFHVTFILNEALMNVEEHAHKRDASKAARVYSGVFEDRVYLSVTHIGEPFDPRAVQTSNFNPDGSLYEGYEKDGRRRGRGHAMMCGLADKLWYENGKDLYMIVRRKG